MELLDAIFELWHAYRWYALLFVIAVPIVVRLYQSRNKRRAQTTCHEHELLNEGSKLDVKRRDAGLNFIASLESRAAKPNLVSRPTTAPRQASTGPKRIVGSKVSRANIRSSQAPMERIQPLVFFSSLGGTTEKTAQTLISDITASTINKNILPPELLDLATAEYEDYFTSIPKPSDLTSATSYFYIILIPTYNIDTILDNFLQHLKEVHHDFRIDTAPLRDLLGYAVFGLGDKQDWPTEEEGFCSQARDVDKWMARLTGSKRAYPLGMGDVRNDADARLRDWRIGLQQVLEDIAGGKSLGKGVQGSGEALESDEEDEAEDEQLAAVKFKRRRPAGTTTFADLESLGTTTPIPVDFTTTTTSFSTTPTAPKQMVPTTSPTYTALTKQGYSIIGSHSGVKICRWTKSALRGRGSCYKYSFYGISSHLCMETTPSLSCSNKCVFCWRHGTNPVGTTWRWVVDPPELIFEGVKKAHYQKIRMMRGVPGVRAERFEEAMRIRHCALSLVGEPIFYPYINEFVGMLHAERISSFLVCNAQHPDQLAALKKVTQLYVSIDASNKESLKKIDRPLHRDFWERFCRCLDILGEKRFEQRTVFRLTLVKGFNIEDEAGGYADLVEKGLPCFVEVKGVTYCGTSTSKGAGLSMQNVPFYEEVCAFVEALNAALARRGLQYGIAAEHAHSCCILLASERFKKDGRWNTTINYARFFELLESGREFRPEDYMAETQEWALWGNGGFDPRDERVKLRGKNKVRPKALLDEGVNVEEVNEIEIM